MTVSSPEARPERPRSLNRWRNRPGRDLVITLAPFYAGTAIYAFSLTLGGDLSGSLMAPLVLALTLPMGLLHAMMVPSWLTLLALALPVALLTVLVVRMPGFVRVPLLLALAGGAIWLTWMMGIVVT